MGGMGSMDTTLHLVDVVHVLTDRIDSEFSYIRDKIRISFTHEMHVIIHLFLTVIYFCQKTDV